MSRVENSKRNIIYGFQGQLIKIIVKFMVRTVIIRYLGAAYLGLDGLFMNVISILSLAEMGLGDAICFALYKPISENNREEIHAYMKFYQKIYFIIGMAILTIGLCLTPFLKYLIKFDQANNINYTALFLLFLSNTVFSYWFGAYRQTLFIASQKAYIISKIEYCALFFTSLAQFLLLIGWKNYYLYVCVMILGNVIKNIYFVMRSDREYPFLRERKSRGLLPDQKRQLGKNVYALALTNISSTVYTSSDNLIISACIGTVEVGYYSNYSYIVSAITGCISILFSSTVASVGDINVSENSEKTYDIFKRMLFINMWVYGFCFICFWQLLTPFVKIWAGEEFVLPDKVVFMIAQLFLIPGLNHTCTIFRAACGLFWQTRYRTVATAIVNVIISVILAPRLGLTGVFLGTIIAYFTTIFAVDPRVLYREVFKKGAGEFYGWYVKSYCLIMLIGIATKLCCSLFYTGGNGGFVIQLVVCCTVPNLIFYLIYRKDESLQYFLGLLIKRKNRG